jgi:hypothetical protein
MRGEFVNEQADWRVRLGWALVIIGGLLVIVGYIGVSGKDSEVLQLPYLASGGVGGLAVVGLGSALLISADVRLERQRLSEIQGELLELQDLVRSLKSEAHVR